ncbi:MAG: PBP1A family penicillin-binding protein [Spirochaetota bacterium]
MSPRSRTLRIARILLVATPVIAIIVGILAGIGIAATNNISNSENFTDFKAALPTKILDIKGRLVTEFSSDEKREMITLKQLPRHLVEAVITREDQSFYTHHGFTLKSLARAFWGKLSGQSLGGGSTITQQLVGALSYVDRTDISFKRKIVELWWALQLERRYTKDEILELYLNRTYMGAGCYGVEAASKFYFGHSSREISLAESAILAIQLSSPTRYNPISNPNNARERSREILDQMVAHGFATKEDADASFDEYWTSFDYTRVASSAYFSRDDKAPWFSEYVRRQLEDMLYGSLDIYKDGFTVHTTLDLDMQRLADSTMKGGIDRANKEFQASSSLRLGESTSTYIPIVEMLGLAFDLSPLFASESKVRSKTFDYFERKLTPTIDAAALLFGIPDLKTMTNASYGKQKLNLEKERVEGALITIENDTGRVMAIVGGSKFDQSNQLIRATQARLMPGSTFKPLYYSAAIDSKKFTEGTLIDDSPVVFYNEDGTPYIPLNFKGEWKGTVLTWYALAHSMNVPSLKVLDGIGFDAAITRAAALLDISDPTEIQRTFPRVYPLGLGVIGVSPIRMARAFSVFANQGRAADPIAIISVEDRDGRIILEPEKDLRAEQKRRGQGAQVISQQTAAVMVDMLQRTVQSGTLAGPAASGQMFKYKDAEGKDYTLPSAGKTGTTQNWADAWTVGFTPYYTTAIWFGFDKPGNSLGVNQSGAVLAGDVWSRYMRGINRGLPMRNFTRPQSGLVQVQVCAVSGQLPTEFCNEGTESLLFLEGTQPTKYCDLHQYGAERDSKMLKRLEDQSRMYGDRLPNVNSTLRIDLPDLEANPSETTPTQTPDTNSLLN